MSSILIRRTHVLAHAGIAIWASAIFGPSLASAQAFNEPADWGDGKWDPVGLLIIGAVVLVGVLVDRRQRRKRTHGGDD